MLIYVSADFTIIFCSRRFTVIRHNKSKQMTVILKVRNTDSSAMPQNSK